MIKTIKKAGIIFSFATVLIGSSTVMAQLCVKSDCDALGYTTTAAACKNHFNTLLCPFDSSKALCGGEVKSAGSGVSMFYINGKLYSVTRGSMGGINYSNANSSCVAKGYRLPDMTEASRISNLREALGNMVSINTYGSGTGGGIWTSQGLGPCSSGQHRILYLDGPRCMDDTHAVNGTICIKEN